MVTLKVEDPEGETRFPCDSCGADMRFDPGEGQLKCDHCGNVEPLLESFPKNSGLQEIRFKSGIEADRQAETQEVRLTNCTNCGAEVEFDGALHSTECPFCASPLVVGTGTTRQIKPQGVLPFQLDEAEARHAMTDWLGSLWFAPNGLQDYARKGRRMTGIYAPHWTYDADTQSSYQGKRGTVYYTTRTVTRDGKRVEVREQKIKWRSVSGHVARWFDDILVLASKSLPKKFTDDLKPWDLSTLEPYAPEYLAGFRSEGYTIRLDEGFKEARQVMEATIRRDVKFDIGGDRQKITSLDTRISDVTFKHVLLPVWLAAYKYRGRTFRFVINGQTGKVTGERPWSWWKIAFAVLLAILVALAVGYFAAMAEQ